MSFALNVHPPGFVLCWEICTFLAATKCAVNQRALNRNERQQIKWHKLARSIQTKGHKEMGVKQGLRVVWLGRVIFFNSFLKSLPEMKCNADYSQ